MERTKEKTIFFVMTIYILLCFVPTYLNRFSAIMNLFKILIIFPFILKRTKQGTVIRKIPKWIFVYGVSIIILTFISTHSIERTSDAFVEGAFIIGCFYIVSWGASVSKGATIRGIYSCITMYVLLNAFLTIIYPEGIPETGNRDPLFFSGGKFSVFYVYLFWMAIGMVLDYYNKEIVQKKKYVFWIVIGIIQMSIVQCSTGIIGLLSFLIILLFFKESRNSKIVAITVVGMLLLTYLVLVIQLQNKIPFVRYFLISVLGEDVTLTGRYYIYEQFEYLMQGHWLVGHGYNTSIVYDTFLFGNTQNGFFQIILQYGILGFLLFITMVITIFRDVINRNNNQVGQVICCSTMLAFLTVSIVEISFNKYFIFLLAVFYYCLKNSGIKDCKKRLVLK